MREILAKAPEMDVAGGQTPARVLLAMIDGHLRRSGKGPGRFASTGLSRHRLQLLLSKGLV